jgi:hypothetical protein
MVEFIVVVFNIFNCRSVDGRKKDINVVFALLVVHMLSLIFGF